MEYKWSLFTVLISTVLCVRVPQNPCPNVFQYYKDTQGNIYGEAVLPYDNATYMEFSVNASFKGQYEHLKLRLELVTELAELNNYVKNVIYNIYFPFTNLIPKITRIAYNNRVYCRGPGEPVIPGSPGITNVWHSVIFRFVRVPNRFYEVPSVEVDQSDLDIPVKDPKERPKLTTPEPMRYNQTLPELRPNTLVPPPKDSRPEADTIDQGVLDAIFTHPTESTTNSAFMFTSPNIISDDGYKCGLPGDQLPNNAVVPLILGASESNIGQFPWLVALFMNAGSKYDYKCSANLISEKHVITAARCIQFYNIQIMKTDQIFLVMGTNSLENWNNNGAITRRAIDVKVHPAFKENSKSAHGDLAIITMDRRVQFSKVLSPVCLWKGNTDLYPLTNKMGVIAGFGQDENSQANGLTHVLRAKRADMPIVSQSECLTSPLGFKDVTSDRTFCTKSGDTPTGPCIGDSGAGFFILMDGVYHLRGVASAISVTNGICDLSNKYSVFCDVAKFSDWIKSNMV
ncbi:serine protease gd-like [Diorhabda carinulata]|uniref:serine protease gd-like n=1 Tax=Diorhabda carinulata TaxID=1163345 RepID=UPI0025A0B289|nr:serine protease gd-like [Diorhabda carinulata]XP_057652015.1 serine protease gd-like [Diorhabda carinulata]